MASMPTSTSDKDMLTVGEAEVAAHLGLSVHTLRKDRQRDRRIPFYKIGTAVRYDMSRVREALASMEQGGPQPRRRRV
jgi:hypothetical protein